MKKGRRGVKGWIIDDIVVALDHLVKNYEKVGARKPEFTRTEVGRLIDWLLYKKKFFYEVVEGGEVLTSGASQRYLKFMSCYLDTWNGAEAARRAGFSPKRAKQTAYDLMRPRTKY